MPHSSPQENTVQQIKDAADIVDIIGEHVSLKKSGINYKGLCPFHGEKTPSFTVSRARNSFHCFGCGEGGDIFSFQMLYHGMTFPEALKSLAARYNITLPEKPLSHRDQALAARRNRLYSILEETASLFHQILLTDPRAGAARDYLESRRIPSETVKAFNLGYAPPGWDFLSKRFTSPNKGELAQEAGLLVKKDQGRFYDRFRNRLLCPIMTMTGQVAGFSGRILGDDQPKYLNSPESPVYDKGRLLYGLYQNRQAIRRRGRCLLVEGNFDLLSLAGRGLDYAVAPLGTALTRKQVRTIKGYAENIVLLFDGDQAGLKAASRAVPIFLAEQVDARVCVLPKGDDPDSFVRQHGPDELEEKINQAVSLPEYLYARWADQYGLDLNGKGKIARKLRELVSDLKDNQLQRTVFISHFSRKLGIPLEQIEISPSPRRPPAEGQKQPETSRTFDLPFKQRQLIEFLIIFPEYLQKFREAGIEEVITSPAGRDVIRHLETALTDNGTVEQDRLLEMAEGPEKTFISRLMVTAPDYSETEKEELAAEKLAWLSSNRTRMLQQNLTLQIEEAQKSGNIKLCMELIARKNSIK